MDQWTGKQNLQAVTLPPTPTEYRVSLDSSELVAMNTKRLHHPTIHPSSLPLTLFIAPYNARKPSHRKELICGYHSGGYE
jgi:hypothetical protein